MWTLPIVNRVCPRCGNANYVRSMYGFSKDYPYKCINCNAYLTEDDFYVGKHERKVQDGTKKD